MTFRQALCEAWRALSAHRLRSTLSGAGLVFGVATVVAALAIAEGARRRAHAEAVALGVDNAYLRAHPPAPGHPPAARFSAADLDVLVRDVRAVRVAAARRVRGPIDQGHFTGIASVAGVTSSWRDAAGLDLAAGRWFSEDEATDRRRVMVLTPRLASSTGHPAPGATVRFHGEWFTVIGVLAPVRHVAGDADAYVPIAAADVRLGARDDAHGAQEILLRADPGGDVERAADAAVRVLARRGHAADAFDVVIPRALLRAKLEARRTFDWVLFGVGGIALTISGIGIMNIMLVSVAERAVEIGVRRAAGARRRDVVAQFAIEAAVLCGAGGMLGVPLGAAFAALVAAGAGWPVAVSPSTVSVALGLAVVAGMTFGVYPARRAAAVDPVVALRG